jgi:hypothetical protein
VPHTRTTNLFAEIQVVPMFILSPKVIQRLVRRQTRRPCCIHRMTNEGQTGEQKLKYFSISAPYHHCAGENGKRGSGCTTCFKRRGRFTAPSHSGRMGESIIPCRRLSDDGFASTNSSRVPGQALSLAGLIRSANPAIWPMTISLNRFPNAAYTVDSVNKGQDQ